MSDEANRAGVRTLAEAIDREDPADPAEREFLLIELRQYLRGIDRQLVQVIEERQNAEILDAATAANFFRSKERVENDKQLLQYMMAFLTRLPTAEEIAGDLVDPFAQFREFVCVQVDQLCDEDVVQAILREYRRRGLVDADNEWYHRLGIVERHEELRQMVRSASGPTAEGWRRLFLALQRYCRFWFDLRQRDMARIRRSDVFMYRLSRMLLAN